MTPVDAPADIVLFADRLRAAGVPVRTSDLVAIGDALEIFTPVDVEQLYWSCRACLRISPDHLDAFDAMFAVYFGDAPAPEPVAEAPAAATPQTVTEPDDGDQEEPAVGLSNRERLRRLRLDQATGTEMAVIEQMLAQVWRRVTQRRTRRTRARDNGPMLDMGRTVAASLATEGEVLSLRRRTRLRTPRSLVLLLDVSGSMSGFTGPLLHLAHMARRDAGRTEVFCFGTSLTRVSRALDQRQVRDAVDAVTRQAKDWGGGTTTGAALRELHERWGRRAILRGAVVVLCSDGLDAGNLDELERQVARLARRAHRVIWVSPLVGGPGYEPIQRGLQRALPHIDELASARSLEGLEGLIDLVAQHHRRPAA